MLLWLSLMHIVIADGLSGLFWLKMNKGQYFTSRSKICLTVINVGVVCIGCIIVSLQNVYFDLCI